MNTDYSEALEILARQEKILQFDSFSNQVAWDLGCLMREEIKRRGIDLTVSIRKVNGHIVFACSSASSNVNHQNWTDRKFNMVNYMECSSLLATVRAHMQGRNIREFGLNDTEYKLCGGGFPIRIKGSGMTHIITVSALAHEQDHDFIICCLEKFTGKTVPHMNQTIPML